MTFEQRKSCSRAIITEQLTAKILIRSAFEKTDNMEKIDEEDETLKNLSWLKLLNPTNNNRQSFFLRKFSSINVVFQLNVRTIESMMIFSVSVG